MKRLMVLLTAALAFGAARADTITLPEAICGAARICASAGVTIRANTQYPSVAVLIGDKTYTSATGGQSVNGSFAHIGPLVLSIEGAVPAEWLILTADFHSFKHPLPGRARSETIWTLLGATIER